MPKLENDQGALKEINKIYVDILRYIDIWEFPDAFLTLINFSGREMQKLQNDPARAKVEKISRKATFSIETLSSITIKPIYHSLLLGRCVNKIRIEMGKTPIDWYLRAVEEDENEKQESSQQ